MKNYKSVFLTFLMSIVAVIAIQGCKNNSLLKAHVYSQLAPGNFLTTKSGINSVLGAAYAQADYNGYAGHSTRDIDNWCTDTEWETGGGENRTAVLMIDFTWDASTNWMFGYMWEQPYTAIRDANTVLGNLKNVKGLSSQDTTSISAQARFIRAISYYRLLMWFGPVPLRTSISQKADLARASQSQMDSFIASELTAVIPELPAPGAVSFGKANSGAARAFLCKFYLNTKQWQKCADVAKQIIDMNYYSLFPNYADMFKVQNNTNKSFIWANVGTAQQDYGIDYTNGAFPPGFAKWPKTGLVMQPNWRDWAAQYRLYDSFYNTFAPNDARKYPIMSEYINTKGDTVSLLNNNNTRSIKYWPADATVNNSHDGNVPVIRYADILLARAEALNEVNGPNQSSIDLINMVRQRAGLSNVTLAQFATKAALRSHILDERGWEFYSEGDIRREDLIRMGKFVSSAVSRGHTNAKSYMTVYPIPQQAMDSNPNLKQNTGY